MEPITLIELRHMRAFVAVAEELHFGHAANRLAITQPALSRIIIELERVLGAVLLVRNTRNARLTEAGSLFAAECRKTLAQSGCAIETARNASKGLSGSVRVGYMEFAIHGLLPRILARFRAAYPEIHVSLDYRGTERQRSALLEREIDVGFLIGPFGAPNLRSVLARRERLVAVLPRRHALAGARTIALEQLAGEDFVLGGLEDWGAFRRILDARCAQAGFAPRLIQEVPTAAGLFGLVAAGMGVTIYVASATIYRPTDVAIVPLRDRDATLDTVAVWHEPGAALPVQRFVETVKALCKVN